MLLRHVFRVLVLLTVVLAGILLLVTLPVSHSLQTTVAGVGADASRLKAYVETLCDGFGPRDASHPDNLDLVADYIAQQWQGFGLSVERQPVQADDGTYQNIIAKLGPEQGELLIIGAHYDVAGPFCGADDNASGVAGILELGRLLAEVPIEIPVHLIAYTLEEPPHFTKGSAVHAQSLKDNGSAVKLMISLEMIGYFTDQPNSQSFPTPVLRPFYPHTGNFILVVGRLLRDWDALTVKRAMRDATSLEVRSIHAPRSLAGIDFSDHRNYWNAGYPALMITDTAFYRNPNYHQASDTPDTLDYSRMAQVIDGVLHAVKALQES